MAKEVFDEILGCVVDDELDETRNIPDYLKDCIGKKTFAETLDAINKEEGNMVVYVGTESGRGWLSITTSFNALDDMRDFCNEWKAETTQALQNKTEEIQSQHRVIDSLTKRKETAEQGNATKTVKDIDDKLAKAEHKLSNAEIAKDKYEKDLNEQVQFDNREVCAILNHCNDEPFGYAIVVTGPELGKYWDINEMIADGKNPPRKSTVADLKNKQKISNDRFPADKTVHEPPELFK